MDVNGYKNNEELKLLLNKWSNIPIDEVIHSNEREQDRKVSLTFNQYSINEISQFFSKFINTETDDYIFGIRLDGPHSGSLQKIQYSDIYYIEAIKNNIYIYTDKNGFQVDSKLYQIEEKYHAFIRINKSTIVNIFKIEQLTPLLNRRLSLTLYDGQELEVSRNYLKDFKMFISN